MDIRLTDKPRPGGIQGDERINFEDPQKRIWDGSLQDIMDAGLASVLFSMGTAASDVDSDLEIGTNKAVFFAPYDMTITEIFAGLGTVCTGAAFIVDINVNGSTILSTKITIDVSENTSLTAGTLPVVSSTSISKGDKITLDIDQIGSTIAGQGLSVYIKGILV